jgi:hypothetical protein
VSDAVSARELVAFFERECELSNEGFHPSMLPHQVCSFPVVLMDLKHLARLGQKLVAPLIRQRLANLVLVAEFRHGLALQALEHNLGFGVGVPCPSVHG